ncbi:aromatic acid exporter family protein [Streptomyces sp. NBC_00083]|uniref:FUSC family protein n=1 Tax=Streptomyces sp. NBC_00083 TaxID=2975647 RepID=UPI002258BD3E|nr:FUSC family protein [Streptomyces sp. NBC_00083]MCX5384425.1 aromatic acid exporter family protein [Streptomyces sp. NBC_00083]
MRVQDGTLRELGQTFVQWRQWASWECAAVARSARRALTGSGPERDTAVQALKAAAAALIAWALAGWWWNAPMAMLAPWTALFLVQSTVYRSLKSALQQFLVVVVGTLLAAGAGALTGNTMSAMLIALPVTMLFGSYARFGTQGLNAPTAALFVLVYGTYSGFDILHRFLETLLGAAIGLAVNALVLPPVHSRSVRHLRGRLPEESAALLHTVADGLDEGDMGQEDAEAWHDRARRLTDRVTDLRTARRWSEESYRFNPGHRLRRSAPLPPAADWDYTWDRITNHLEAITRTLAETAVNRSGEAALPGPAPRIVAELLRAAGDVCGLDDTLEGSDSTGKDADEEAARRTRDRREALRRAYAAETELTSVFRERGDALQDALAAVTADTIRLLGDLSTVAGRDPEDGTDEEAGARHGDNAEAGGAGARE